MKFILFICTVIILLSCDSMRHIYIKNESDGTAQITWTIKEDSILCSPLFISNNPEVKFILEKNPFNVINMSFGYGSWDVQTLTNFVDDLESMELNWVGGNIKFSNADSIKTFLFNRRVGIDKRKISIRFLNPLNL